jgi:hypothetical protein
MAIISRHLSHQIARFIHPEDIPRLLVTPNKVFGGETPQVLIDRGEESRIFEAIDRLKSGTS